jgi:hypothetical protein
MIPHPVSTSDRAFCRPRSPEKVVDAGQSPRGAGNINGDVHLTAWDRNELKVDAQKRAHSQERLDDARIVVREDQENSEPGWFPTLDAFRTVAAKIPLFSEPLSFGPQ